MKIKIFEGFKETVEKQLNAWFRKRDA